MIARVLLLIVLIAAIVVLSVAFARPLLGLPEPTPAGPRPNPTAAGAPTPSAVVASTSAPATPTPTVDPTTALVRDVKLVEDFEAVMIWAVGLAQLECPLVMTLRSPLRLVIDLASAS